MQTQAVFDVEKAKLFLREIQGYPVPILLGIFPCKSYGVAEFISKNVPGMSVPKEFMEELKKAEEVEDNSRRRSRIDEINVRYFTDFIKEVKRTTHASGIHIMTVGYEGIVKAIVENVER